MFRVNIVWSLALAGNWTPVVEFAFQIEYHSRACYWLSISLRISCYFLNYCWNTHFYNISWHSLFSFVFFFTARISSYDIPQGQQPWKDIKYSGNENSKHVLQGGIGCLIDGRGGENPNPLVSPECWIGWRRDNVTSPFVKIDLTRPAPIKAIRLRTYIDDGVEAGAIKKFVVRTSKLFGVIPDNTFYACAPKHFYYRPRVLDFELDIGNVVAQYITLQMEYSSDLILLRQIFLNQSKTFLNLNYWK